MKKKKIISLYPWVDQNSKSGDKYQALFDKELRRQGYDVQNFKFNPYFPLFHIINKNVDVIFLDWIHSFYTSQSTLKTVFKIIIAEFDFFLTKNHNKTLIWNLHNLNRHDAKFKTIEHFYFKRLAKKVSFIRIFKKSHYESVCKYLNQPDKIIYIPQGNYDIQYKSDLNIRKKYKIPNNKILLFFGSIRENKGIIEFANTFSKCIKNEWTLLVTGSTNNLKLKKNLIEVSKGNKNIILDLNFIDEKYLHNYFKQCDLLVLPYLQGLNSGILKIAEQFGIQLLASELFLNHLDSDKHLIGNIFDSCELKKLLNKKSIKIKPQTISWDYVVQMLEPYIDD